MNRTANIFPRLVSLDLSEEQKTTFFKFCSEYLRKEPSVVTYADIWNYASDKHIHDIKHNEVHTEIMKIMWGIFMKKDDLHSKVFFNLIPRDETRKMIEGLYKLLIKNDWL